MASALTQDKSTFKWAINKQYSTWLALMLIVLISAFARGWTPYAQVFKDDGTVRLLGVDPYFHLRQSRQILQNFPHIERHDTGTHFPKGADNDATGLLNILIASTTLVTYGSDATIDELAEVSVWLTFLLGSLCTILLFLLTQNLLGNAAALLAVTLFTLFPGTFLERSLLGFADQHVAEVCLALLLTYALVKLLQQDSWHLTMLPKLTLYSLPFILLAYTWRGAVIYLPILAFAILCYLPSAIHQGKDPKVLKQILCSFAAIILAFFIVLHFIWPALEMSPQGTRWLMFGMFGLAIFCWGYISLLERCKPEKRTQFALLGLGLICLIVALVFLTTSIGIAISSVLFEQRDQMVREQVSIDFANWFKLLGLSGILGLAGLIVSIVSVAKKEHSPLILLPQIIGLLLLIMWLSTGDFGYLIPPFMAFSAAIAVSCIRPINIKYSAPATIALAVVLLSLPTNSLRKPWFSAAEINTLIIYPEGWYNAASWLKKNTPITTWHEGKPDYGVITPWEFGNIVASHSERIPVWSRYPSGTIHHWLSAQNESQAQQWLCRKCKDNQSVKYAMVDAASVGNYFAAKATMAGQPIDIIEQKQLKIKQGSIPKVTFNQIFDNAMVTRLYVGDGIGLKHYRLVYETPQQHYVTSHLAINNGQYDFIRLSLPLDNAHTKKQYERYANSDVVISDSGYLYDGGIFPSVKIFEIVPGANIGGKAALGTVVKAKLQLKVNSTGRQFEYVQTATANQDGRYRLTVPYPTSNESDNSDVSALSAYQLWVKLPGEVEFKQRGEFNIKPEQIYH